jgi:multimeric flavodoxin WrbA
MACKNGETACVLQDDLTAILSAIHSADILVLASPIYDQDVTAAMKAFVERTHSFLDPHGGPVPGNSRLEPGKKIVFVFAQGNTADMHTDVYPKYREFFKWYGFEPAYLLRACEVIKPGDILNQLDTLASAKALAKELCAREG